MAKKTYGNLAAVDAQRAPRFYGGAEDMFLSRHPEIILSGPYESGKTYPCLYKFFALLMRYPRSKGLMLRKTYTDLLDAILSMWDEDILPMHPDLPGSPVRKVGGPLTPKHYILPNGSSIRLRGLDKANRLLSGAFDFIYVCQAEELTLDEWQAIGSRCTPRASSKRPAHIRPAYNQIIADCNPDSNLHWIINPEEDATYKVYHSIHKDNPMLWTTPGQYDSGEWTKDGLKSYRKLSAMTGIRYRRGYLGEWVAAEGQVYEYDRAHHLIDEMPQGWERWPKYASIDFGQKDPFVHQWWARSPNDELYLYREIYRSGVSINEHARHIRKLERKHGDRIVFRVADHDKDLQVVLREHGIRCKLADKRVEVGIEEVQKRLQLDPQTGKPRIFFLSTALVERDRERWIDKLPSRTTDEFAEYVYPDGHKRNAKDLPLPGHDHGMDALRYMSMAFTQRAMGFKGFHHGVTRQHAEAA